MADQVELSGTNTMPILPPELWMQVFEEIYPDEGGLYQQRLWRRYEAIKTFHNIQLVCKQWADLVEPLMFERFMAIVDNTGNSDILNRFVERFQLSELTSSPKPNWIRQLWLQGAEMATVRQAHEGDFHSIIHVLRHLSNLSEFRIDIPISVKCFQAIADGHAKALKRMAVHLRSEELPQTIPLLDRFQALQELKLTTCASDSDPALIQISQSDGKFPELRSLDLFSEDRAKCLLEHFSPYSLPKLSMLEAGWQSEGGPLELHIFLTQHGANLATLRLCFYQAALDPLVLGLTPKLEEFELWLESFPVDSPSAFKECLYLLPDTVTSVILTSVIDEPSLLQLDSLADVLEVMADYRTLPTFRFISRTDRLGWVGVFSWDQFILHIAETVNGGPALHGFIRRMETLGAVLVDDAGDSLTQSAEYGHRQLLRGCDSDKDDAGDSLTHSAGYRRSLMRMMRGIRSHTRKSVNLG
ncbi:hypothetical protein IQ07DRAFT_676785 [Pyrenochaeta sp. DS3sAY3a]|nr:hypothetical protein IQ07DRAFT_676785 [Pyrenochaeta sp. DS3sAY3a]